MTAIDRERIKGWATAMVAAVEPGDVFVVEDGFDTAVDDWHRARPQDEGRFIGGAEAYTYAAMVVPFLLGFFGDVAKDLIKDAAKEAAGHLLDKVLGRRASPDEFAKLRETIARAVATSRFTKPQKKTLEEGLDKLFEKVAPSPSGPAKT